MTDAEKIAGYHALSAKQVSTMNEVKAMESTVLGMLGRIMDDTDSNKRWCAIAKTDLEKGFMALCRSVARPNGE